MIRQGFASVLLALIAAAAFVAIVPSRLLADTASRIQGLIATGGSITNVAPVVIGASNAGVITPVQCNGTGEIGMAGNVADGSAAPNGVVVAGKDGSGNVRTAAVVVANGTYASPPTLVVGGFDPSNAVHPLSIVANGSAGSSVGLQIGGQNPASNFETLQTDTLGRLQSGDTSKATYSGASTWSPAGNATIFQITGSGTKLVKVRKIVFAMTATSATLVDVFWNRMSTISSGGVPAAIAQVQLDTSDPAATLNSLNTWASNPATAGTSAGTVVETTVTAAAAGTQVTPVVIDFTQLNSKGFVINGTAQGLAAQLNGVSAPAGAAAKISIEWTEE